MWEQVSTAVALFLVVVGPGSGLYLAARKSGNGALADLAEIKVDLKAFGESAQKDRTTMLRGLDRVDSLDKGLQEVRAQGQGSHELLITHRHKIQALEKGRGADGSEP